MRKLMIPAVALGVLTFTSTGAGNAVAAPGDPVDTPAPPDDVDVEEPEVPDQNNGDLPEPPEAEEPDLGDIEATGSRTRRCRSRASPALPTPSKTRAKRPTRTTFRMPRSPTRWTPRLPTRRTPRLPTRWTPRLPTRLHIRGCRPPGPGVCRPGRCRGR